ncbi:MAG: Gfo/Idh/MocA family oxidoreductase, partial [Muribaculaceae bacterium]|nr:Gfo/Idh/MocA family oxidoreductase [Muribaculaceae bacterium]
MSSRREFLRKAFASAATLAAAGIIPGGFMASAASSKRTIGANDRIRVGVIGVNSRGRALAQGFARMPLCDVTYLCDVDSKALERSQADIKNITGTTPKGERDMRRVFESPDVDAIVIALPDHWHAPAAIMAMQAGKHVYLEKPTSHSPAENDLLVRAAAKYGTVVQVGNQRRSWPNVIAAIDEIKNGTIGDVHYAKSWYVNNRPSIGVGKVVPVPDDLDGALWHGPAPRGADF